MTAVELPGVELPGMVRRVRRVADLSQRQLAVALEVSQTSVAAAEAGRQDWQVGLLARAAALAGLRVVLVDSQGRIVPPMAPGSPRDRAGRRLPAHLDTRHGDVDWWHGEERYSRERPEWTYDVVRETRDWWRERQGTPADHDRPGPGDSLAERAEARRRAARAVRAQRHAEYERALRAGEVEPPPGYSCCCPAGCDDLLLERTPAPMTSDTPWGRPPVHVPDCPCRCDVG